MAKPLLGIRVIPSRHDEIGETHKIELDSYRLEVGFYQRRMHKQGTLFISTPPIRERMHELQLKPGHRIGSVQVHIDHHFKTVAENWYYPTGEEKRLKGLMIGSLLDLVIEKKYSERFPHYSIIGTMEDSRARLAQLMKRGRDLSTFTPIKEGHRQTRKYVIRKYHEHKSSRPPPKRKR